VLAFLDIKKDRQYTVTGHSAAFLLRLLQWKSNNYKIFQVCEFVALGTQHAMRMRHIVIRGLSNSTTFIHIISQTACF
jgi:hypothetical protein